MNLDEAMEIATSTAITLSKLEMAEVSEVIAAEVERLRAELALLRKDWCDDDETIKQQALRVLDAAKVEGDSWSVPRGSALAEMMADKLVEVKAELAAAKAASEVPVRVNAFGADGYVGNLVAYCDNADAARKLHDWLRDRMKERGEG